MMDPVLTWTPEGEKATELILTTFRVHGLLLAAGDLLTAEHGLTSARWQVLGAIAYAQRPLTVPQIARRMGLTRQTVHTTVNHLLADGAVELVPNEDHRRSPLVRLTEPGQAKFRAIDQKQTGWVNRLGAGLDHSDLEAAVRVLAELSARLEADPAVPQDQEGNDHEP
jgi:DNA-binding MarR family transcriptional regulator